MADRDCTRLHDLADELALGVLTGQERVEARTHLANCPDCRGHVLELTMVSDGLLALVPGAEPPVGFEDRVLSRMGINSAATGDQISGSLNQPAPITEPIPVQAGQAGIEQASIEQAAGNLAADLAATDDLDRAKARRTTSRRRAPRWLPSTAAAAAIALVFGLGGWAGGWALSGNNHGQQSSPTAVSASGLLHGTLVSADHKTMGKVWALAGNPSWLYMDVDTKQHTGMTVTCQVQQADGSIVTIGSFALSNGYGHWGAPAPVGKGIKTRLVDGEGSLIATANLTT